MKELKPILAEDLLQYRFPENLQYSPSGKLLAFQTAEPDKKENTYHRQVWIIENGTARQLTSTADSTLVMWEDDAHLILCRQTEKTEKGITDLYRMDLHGGEAMPWMQLPFGIGDIRPAGKNRYVLSAVIDSQDPDAYLDSPEIRKGKQEQRKTEQDYQVVDEIPYYFNGRGFINKKRTALFVLEQKKLHRITDPLLDTVSFDADGNRVIYAGQKYSRSRSNYHCIKEYKLDTHKTVQLIPEKEYSVGNVFFLNGKVIVQASDLKHYGTNETNQFYEIENGTLKPVQSVDRSLYDSAAVDTLLGSGKNSTVQNQKYYTLAAEEDHIEIWSYDRDLKQKKIYSQPGMIAFLDVSNEKIAFCASSWNALPEIYECGLNGTGVKQLTHLNEACMKDKRIARPHRIDCHSAGMSLHGWVLMPQITNQKKIPAVLDIHGGPRAIYTEAFFHEMQVWASKGYAVFFANIAGSDGRGDAFADLRERYGEIDYQNLMDFTDAVLNKYPQIDEKKLGVTGGSYGGYMTNWIIGHTNRFACAASQRSIASWISMSFTSDIGEWFGKDQCGADNIYQDTDKLWKCSPLKYADKVKTPTLFIHSDQDYRCPLSEGMQMMQALAYRKAETRMVIFHGENHELSRSGKPQHRIRRLKEITGWFDSHLTETKTERRK